ncbi:MAG: methyl-accepting chemotaxis protein [Burkholderiaceae bacterium]
MATFKGIRGKLLGFSAMALTLVVAAGGAGWWAVDRLSEASKDVSVISEALKQQQSADMMHDAIRGDMLAAVLAAAQGDLARAKEVKAEEAEHSKTFRDALGALNALPLSAEIDAAVKAVAPKLDAYVSAANTSLGGAAKGEQPDAAALAAFQAQFEAVEASMGELSDLIAAQVELRFQRATDLTTVARYVLIGVVLVAVALLFVMGALLARGIVGPLEKAAHLADAVAAGDLTVRIEGHSRDETGQLLNALRRMSDSLSSTVSQVRSATENINTASSEIASGNQDLSARTEQAASNLEETAASMEELTSTVSQSADAARQANQLAASASEVAVRGGQVVGQVVTTMEEINHSSKKINDIIGVIDGIAFQTNILALNAAVEAARAGEQGRGFAVVAAEVRSLAQRSAEAAKEIKGLIGTSVDKVDVGSRLVAEAGQTMNEIVGSVQRVTDIIGEITAASGEQSSGIAQVNTAVNQLDQMTQQNAALVEESAAAAESLRDQAVKLAQVVQVFRLSAEASPAPALPAPQPKAAPRKVTPKAAPPVSVAQEKPVAKLAPNKPSRATESTGSPVGKLSASAPEGDWESF